MPRDTTRWKRALSISAVIFSISLGLCGANYLVVAHSGNSEKTASFFIFLGFLELIGMAVGAIGVVISLLGLIAFSLLSDDDSQE